MSFYIKGGNINVLVQEQCSINYYFIVQKTDNGNSIIPETSVGSGTKQTSSLQIPKKDEP
jgi:hypothetical protein